MEINRDLTEKGFEIVADAVMDAEVLDILRTLKNMESAAGRPSEDRVHALRNLFQAMPEVRALAASSSIRALVEPYLGGGCFAVRAIFFDKLPSANWRVPWHQDLSIAVSQRRESAGFGPWSIKAGVPHVQAPVSLLERMLTVRLHLDPCSHANGPLRVLPGTHRLGRLEPLQIARLRSEVTEFVCEVERGGALLMRPLLLHASAPAVSAHHRRVIHLEYAATSLPDGLNWFDSIGSRNRD